jgi:excisionase family DNA binding protein
VPVPEVVAFDNQLPEPPTLEPMVTPAELAEAAKVHHRTIWREIRRHRLRATKIGGVWRISRQDAIAYLSGGAA